MDRYKFMVAEVAAGKLIGLPLRIRWKLHDAFVTICSIRLPNPI